MSRYIDADALIETLKKRYWHYVRNYGENDEYANCIDDCMDIVLDQPTADVKPVVRGRNIINGHPVDGFICSECGFGCDGWSRVVYDEEADDLHYCEYEFKFCPNCGADMRGEKE